MPQNAETCSELAGGKREPSGCSDPGKGSNGQTLPSGKFQKR